MALKPCPFCEQETDIHVVDVTRPYDLRFKYEYQPGCENDKCPGEWGGSSYCSADEAYEKWNTRATDPLLKEMADALEAVQEWNKARKFIVPYRVTDPIYSVLKKYREQEATNATKS